MEGSYSGKRSRSHFDSDPSERNYDNKRRHPGNERGEAMPGLDDTVYRILCPGKKIGSVIGKGGGIIKGLRQDTHAKIKVADGIPGVDERVIIIFSGTKDRRRERDMDDEDYEKGDIKPLCPAQDALFRVHARIMEDDMGASDDEEGDGKGKQATARLLVPNNQIGCLLGKGGKVIEKMRSDTKAQIKILPKEQLPDCAMASDELVQIMGSPSVVKRALYEVSARLHENPPRDRPSLNTHVPAFSQNPFVPSAGHLFSSANVLAPPVGYAPQIGGYRGDIGTAWPLPVLGEPPLGRRSYNAIPEEFSFQMLCRNDRIGGVIGKGGSTINQIRKETTASIKVIDQVPDCDERVILVSCQEYAEDQISPTLEAVVQLQPRTSDKSTDEGKEGVITTRFLVPSHHIGCLLGKGGSIISEMRKRTRANIRIMSKDNLPKCASENDELVQIMGEFEVARDALVQIVTRLRANVFKDKDGGASATSVAPGSFSFISMPGSIPQTGFGGRQDLGSPSRIYSLSGLDFQGTGGRLSAGSYGSLGGLQNGGVSGYGPLSGYSTGRTTSSGSSLGATKNSSGTSTEVTIPNKSVGSILGRGGSNIAQIREISGAKVKLHDARPGESDRIVEISGTPEQMHAAQSLLQAFAMSGQQGSGGSGSRVGRAY